jgi:ubiquinone/menaquinone biosynthesis C-methylase UbiE
LPRICDYEGSQYRTDFWENQNRSYENKVERVAMQTMLPPAGRRLVEVGAGFGRLVDLYQGYEQVVLTDYARTQLEEAQAYLGADDRFVFVVADVYNMPFVDNLFDTLTMVRVMHHLVNVPLALRELQRIMAPQGTAIIEYASKFHLKSLTRWLLGRQSWSPFDQTPLEFVELNFDFHPAWMHRQVAAAGLQVQDIRTLSHYRLDLLKRLLPTAWLVSLDRLAQPTGRWWQLTPSVFLKASKAPAQTSPAWPATAFFRCPHCQSAGLARTEAPPDLPAEALLVCHSCHLVWSYQGGIYDFKSPLQAA